MKVKQMVGREARHKTLGKVIVTSVPKGSRTRVEIKVIDRGPGWDDRKEVYKGVKRWIPNVDECKGAKSLNWSRGENRQYGHQDVVHKDELTLN